MKTLRSLPILFLLGALIMIGAGVISQLVLGNSTLDIHLHDTYFIIGHFHIIMAAAICFLIFSGIYYIVPKLTGRALHYGLGIFHFACTLIGMLCILWPMHYEGIAGMPRRYYDYSAWNSLKQFISLNWFVSIMTLIFLIGQVVFAFNFLFSIVAGKRIAK